ncbi:hypothetical protein KP509_19G004300 [Ceratopteris richardii]|uniref:Uncharacterized protein n=1 Tax=Ceratopteris richardii TaxID=49495 RepID=A0A8T2SLJ4_CERRI|nr:hypothetical protein KP509_19G004300 [Ceratopteris richardii]
MESLFNERLFVRTRHLEERLGNLSKQLAAQREDNAHLQKSHTEAKRKVQLLEEELKSARERCHKLTMKLSFSRRHAQKKSPRYEEDEYLESIEPMELGKQTICFVCDRCASTIQSSQFGHMGSCKTNRSRELVPNFMGVMPARLNSRLMKSKKTCKSNLNSSLTAHYARHTDAQQESGDLNDLCGCMKGCGDVELLLAHRLCLCDPNHNDGISTQQDQIKKHLLQNLTGDTTDHKFSKGSKP